MKNKEVVKIQFWRYDVIKWRHNVKIFVDLKSTHPDLSYEVLYDRVPYGTDLGVRKFRPAAIPMKVKANRPQKLISWVAAHQMTS
jgi:hypothetical protein